MNKLSNIRMEQSVGIVYDKVNMQQARSTSIASTSVRFLSLVEELKDVRKELKLVTKERDMLQREVLNCIQII